MMDAAERTRGRRGLRAAACGGLVVAAFVAGAALVGLGVARADVRESSSHEHFKSGGARSEIVLREIAATLKRIEARLERLDNWARRQAEP
jgi:predicted GNAT superfamily acetyltransferase